MPSSRRAEQTWLCALVSTVVLAACGADGDERALDASSAGASATLDAATPARDAGSDGGVSLYPAVAAIVERSCAYLRCHAGPIVGAGLSLAPGTDFRALLVGVTACEYDGMQRVEPGHPERSWLMVKLTAPFRPLNDRYATQIYFDPPAGWDPSRRDCRDQTDEGGPLFGQRMPSTAPNMLPDEEVALIGRWIEQGAPP